jgi:Phytanoyl-CoA dioxygenase (PhyH)
VSVSNDSGRNKVEEEGYAILPQIVSPDIVNEISDEISQSACHRSRAGVRHAMRLASVRDVAYCSELMIMACSVLGPLAFPFRATIFDKSQDANWLVVWHQDTALPLRHRLEASGWGPWSTKEGIAYAHAPAEVLSQVLALRIHLDDSTADNGPLKILPGTHKLGVLDDGRIHQLLEQVAVVECVVPRGGVLAMRPLLVHASSKSCSEVPRRVLHIEYAASDSVASPLELEVV